MDDATRNRIMDRLERSAILDPLVRERSAHAWPGLERLASDLGVPMDCVTVHPSLEILTVRAVASVLKPGDVLGLAEPCRESWLRGALACGARFLDVGRDHLLHPMEMALRRALEDGNVDAVLIEHPAIAGGGTLDLPDDHDPFIFVDQSASTLPEVAVDTGVLHLGQTDGVAWAVGTPERLARLGGVADVPNRQRDELVSVEAMAGALESTPLTLCQPGGVALWARMPGVLGEELERVLLAAGVDVRRRAHPSWREGVAMAPPRPEDLETWSTSVASALSSLSDTE